MDTLTFAVVPYVERNGTLVADGIHYLDTMIKAIKVARYAATKRPGVQVLALAVRVDHDASVEVLRVYGAAPQTFSAPTLRGPLN